MSPASLANNDQTEVGPLSGQVIDAPVSASHPIRAATARPSLAPSSSAHSRNGSPCGSLPRKEAFGTRLGLPSCPSETRPI